MLRKIELYGLRGTTFDLNTEESETLNINNQNDKSDERKYQWKENPFKNKFLYIFWLINFSKENSKHAENILIQFCGFSIHWEQIWLTTSWSHYS